MYDRQDPIDIRHLHLRLKTQRKRHVTVTSIIDVKSTSNLLYYETYLTPIVLEQLIF